ncbi:hypothetical protein [Paenibacillus harenae]|uniref:hypothetical protein n=1 Tax=Paenibacillus harenae TaxID=306543 RepID=UPI0027925609|nr:hypothetical protein [Paenibacillus harenae]MDQ0061259.1 putative DNA-binding transcriptional regulator [Paenibacillus harenae]
MGLKEAASAALLIVALGMGVRKLLKRGLVREYMVYASCVIWTGYLFAAENYKWNVISPITIISAAFKPLGIWLQRAGWIT